MIVDELLMRAPATELVLLDFYAPWCAPCKALAMMLPKLEESLGGRLSVVKIDIDAEPDVASEMDIRSIPHLVLLQRDQNGAEIIGTKTGMSTLPQLVSWIDVNVSSEF